MNSIDSIDQKPTIINSLVFYSYLVETVSSGVQVDNIYTFDKVNCYLLLTKLRKIGFRDDSLYRGLLLIYANGHS